MKLVTFYVDSEEASAARSRLCEAGVVAELAVVDPHVIQPSKSGAERIGLWVVFDEQFEDAVLLLENPDHVPVRKIALDEMKLANLHKGRELLKTASNFVKKLQGKK